MRKLSSLSLLSLCAATVGLVAPGLMPCAQSAYRYRDSNGQWVYADRAAAPLAPAGDSISLPHESAGLHLGVERTDSGESTQLIAVNDCLCVITVRVQVTHSNLANIPQGARYQATLSPHTRQTLVQAVHGAGRSAALQYAWRTALGSPQAIHTPPRPYRVPFAVGASFTVTQAFPTHVTHVTPDSQYAVDFALPDDTPVYAAREGTVINVRHDSFEGAPLPEMMDKANVIEILHDDGTIAVYAHLHWDSIRVHPGQPVACGEYIANSGNTGFTTGPHLHFAVWRNTGSADVSIPVQFAGIGGVAVTPTTATTLTAY